MYGSSKSVVEWLVISSCVCSVACEIRHCDTVLDLAGFFLVLQTVEKRSNVTSLLLRKVSQSTDMDGTVPKNGNISVDKDDIDSEAMVINKLHSVEDTTNNAMSVDELRHSRTPTTLPTSRLRSPPPVARDDCDDRVGGVKSDVVKSDSNGNDLHNNNTHEQNERTGVHHHHHHQSPQQPRHLPHKPSFMISDILGSVSRKRPRSPVYCSGNEHMLSRHGRDSGDLMTSHDVDDDDHKMDDDSRVVMSSSDCESSDDGDTRGECHQHSLPCLHYLVTSCVTTRAVVVSRSVLSSPISRALNDIHSTMYSDIHCLWLPFCLVCVKLNAPTVGVSI